MIVAVAFGVVCGVALLGWHLAPIVGGLLRAQGRDLSLTLPWLGGAASLVAGFLAGSSFMANGATLRLFALCVGTAWGSQMVAPRRSLREGRSTNLTRPMRPALAQELDRGRQP